LSKFLNEYFAKVKGWMNSQCSRAKIGQIARWVILRVGMRFVGPTTGASSANQ
jgi:hypothetical protein